MSTAPENRGDALAEGEPSDLNGTIAMSAATQR
jgi:hypothetical protein